MQDFNHISSIWQNQNHDEKLISADEMLRAIQSQIQKVRQKHRLTIFVLVILGLVLFLMNIGLHFQWLTHMGLTVFNIAVFTAVYQFLQLKKLLNKSDYSKDNQSFINDYIHHQKQKIRLYERYYWLYTCLLILGLTLCMIELSHLYAPTTLGILIFSFIVWISFCSLIIRKLTIKKAQKECDDWTEKIQKFGAQNQ